MAADLACDILFCTNHSPQRDMKTIGYIEPGELNQGFGHVLHRYLPLHTGTITTHSNLDQLQHMPEPIKTVAVVNGTGRQAASLIRTISAVGWAVRAQVHSLEGLVAEELADLDNVTLLEGPLLNNPRLIEKLFEGAQYAFINTISMAGDEVKIGRALADAAKRARVQHYIYGSMPDHSAHNPQWPSLPMWAPKFTVENYIRQLGMPATYLYTGIYNNNFTSLPYPLFQMEFKDDDTLEWRAPFHPNTKLPWLDAEHDVGPAILQIFKDGPSKWRDRRIALAFENLTPIQVCQAFGKALERPCKYVYDQHIDIKVPIPVGYREQLEKIEVLFGQYNAPYFPGADFEYRSEGRVTQTDGQRRSSETIRSKPRKLTTDARQLWEGWRSILEYAREAFPIEEEANGKTWMRDKSVST